MARRTVKTKTKIGELEYYADSVPTPSYLTEIAIEIAQFLKRWGRIKINRASHSYGTVLVDITFTARTNLGLRWQVFVYKWAYTRALKKYTDISVFIWSNASYPELLWR